MPASRGTQASRDSRFSSRWTYRPSVERAAPAMRASCLKVLDVATTWSGAPKRLNSPDRTGDLGADMAAQGPDVLGVRRVAGQPARGEAARAERQRDGRVGLLVDAVRDLQGAAADVEDEQLAGRPAEPAAGGEEGEPGLLGAGEDLELDAGLGLHAREDVVGVAGLAHGGGRERQQVLDALVLGGLERLVDDADQLVDPLGTDGPGVVEELGKAQLRLVRVRGQRARAGVRVHHQQMHRVRSHVEDTESHVRNATASRAAAPPQVSSERLVRAHLPWTRAKDEKGEGRQDGQIRQGFFAGEGSHEVRRRRKKDSPGPTRRGSTSRARGWSSLIRRTTSRSSAAI